MARSRKVWRLLPNDTVAASHLARQIEVSPVIGQLLLNRQVRDPTEARQFLNCELRSLYPPQCLVGIDEAACRIGQAVAQGRKICVYGDYDVDGVTGTAILLRLLTALGIPVDYFTPSRLTEGYGLHAGRLRDLAGAGVKLVVSVDCGIASLREAEEAKRLGLELIVTDHHEPKVGPGGPLLPAAAAVVHPRLPDGRYPFPHLCGSGVAFKLAWAVAQHVTQSKRLPKHLREVLLDGMALAAIGLIADVMPLRGENRIFVRHGLNRLRARPLVGLRALLEEANIPLDRLMTAEDIGFRLAPRLNAAGRLGCARMAVDLLTTEKPERARQLAQYLERQNRDRQVLERQIAQQAKEIIDREQANDPAIVVGSVEWHPGVVGIVANRLVDHYGRPALVLALPPEEDGLATGSGRSIPGLALNEILRACEGLLESHGGHAAAAGFKLRVGNIPAFRRQVNHLVARQFPSGLPAAEIVIDTEVPLSALTPALLKDLERLEPYGCDNPRPRFLACGLQVESPRTIGRSEPRRHIEFRVRQGQTVLRCVGWGMADRLDELLSGEGECCVVFTPRLNDWQGQRQVELQLIDFAPGPRPPLV